MRNLGVEYEALWERSFPFILALLAFLGSFQILDAFRVGYYPMVHRMTNLMRFDLGVNLVVPLAVLLVFWVGWLIREQLIGLTVFPIVGLLFYSVWGLEVCIGFASLLAVAGGLWSRRCFATFFLWIVGLLAVVEGLALLHWVVFVPMGWVSPFVWISSLEMSLFYISGYVSPLLVISFLFSWIIKPILSKYFIINDTKNDGNVDGETILSRFNKHILFLSFILCILSILFVYSINVNPTNRLIGVDAIKYITALDMIKSDVNNIFKVWDGTRPIIFFIMYCMQTVLKVDSELIVKYMPVFLFLFMSFSIYFFSRIFIFKNSLSCWMVFFMIVGIQIPINIYSYFLSNMLALSFMFLSLGFLFRSINTSSKYYFILSIITGILTTYSHYWTFELFYISLSTSIMYYIFINKENNNTVENKCYLYSYITIFIIIDIATIFYFNKLNISSIDLIIQQPFNIYNIWNEMIFGFRLMYGGMLSNMVLWVCIVCGVYVNKYRTINNAYINMNLLISSILFIISNAQIQTRIIINLPIGIYAAFGFNYIIRKIKNRNLKYMFIILIILYFSTNLFRSINNMI